MESSSPYNPTAISNLEGNIVIADEIIDMEEGNSSSSQFPVRGGQKKGKRRSAVWEHFEEKEIRGESKVVCIHCGSKFKSQRGGPTSHLQRHLKACPRYGNLVKGQQLLTVFVGNSSEVTGYKYDEEAVKNIMAKMLIVDDMPFSVVESNMFNLLCKTLQPCFERFSENAIKAECMKIYSVEKEKFRKELDNVDCISITCDMWTSTQTKEYMNVTAHYVDSEWQLQKRILNFVHVPSPPGRVIIAEMIRSRLLDWKIEDKISTITLDDEFSNEMILRTLQNDLKENGKGSFQYGSDYFHVCYCTHTLNMIVKDSLEEIKHAVVDVLESVNHVTSTEERRILFENICKQLNLSTKVTISDNFNQWSTTYLMLESAIQVKEAFVRYADYDRDYIWSLQDDVWRKAEQVCRLLSLFYNAINIFSGSKSPTSNLLLLENWKIKYALMEISSSPSDIMRTMVDKIQSKYDKCWSECNVLMSVAVVLDPRWKMAFIEFIFKKIYPDTNIIEIKKVEDKLHEIYNMYVQSSGSINASESGSTRSISASDVNLYDDFDTFVAEKEKRNSEISELQLYLKECTVHLGKGVPFDVLSWWRQNTIKYKILSRMARDILTIPISTVSFEKAFNTNNKVISPHRSNLSPETTEALICAQDWLRFVI